jgi:hypothetical protein
MALDLLPNKRIFIQRDVRETPISTTTATASSTIIAPIGSLLPWLKSYTNTPQTLPTGWVEADGSTVSDAASVYNGQALPDLNGGEFLRGFTTSGGTGGATTNTATLATSQSIGSRGANDNYGIVKVSGELKHADAGSSGSTTYDIPSTTTSAFNISPLYYNVVWIIRIK